jgi:hypothetical protein
MVVRRCLDNYETMPAMLNLIEPNAPTRWELTERFLKNRPDLSVVHIPSPVFRGLSIFAKLIQRVIRSGEKPIDIYAAFASEKYDSSLARIIIEEALKK